MPLKSDKVSGKGRLFLIAVATSKYADPLLPRLGGAIEDASTIRDVFRLSKLYQSKDEDMRLLNDEANLEIAFRELA